MNVRRLARVWIPPLARVHPGTRPPRMRPPFHGSRRMRGSCHIALINPPCALAHPAPISRRLLASGREKRGASEGPARSSPRQVRRDQRRPA